MTSRSPGTADGFAQHRAWERELSAAGYGGIAWPAEYGGRGADVITQAIFEEEYLAAGAPERVTILGQKLMAPTLMAHGTDEQKQRWLPRILSAEDIWSQGFSEPGAGSDLAAIRTRGERAGDEFVLNGQKIWTSYGAFADWIFVLCRTDPSAERHAGITFIARRHEHRGCRGAADRPARRPRRVRRGVLHRRARACVATSSATWTTAGASP